MASAAQVPQLIDLELAGSKDAAYFTPDSITLQEGQLYLFVIHNPFDFPYRFISDSFSQSIATQYIQGSPAVTKNSITISPRVKVQWLFQTKKAGHFEYYAGSYDHKKMHQRVGRLHILSNTPTAAPAVSEDQQKQKRKQVEENTQVTKVQNKEQWKPHLRGGRP